MPLAVKQQAGTGLSVDLPLPRPAGESAWPSHLCCKMSSDHNRPERAIVPYFTKKFGELGLSWSDRDLAAKDVERHLHHRKHLMIGPLGSLKNIAR